MDKGFGRHFTFDGIVNDMCLIEPERVKDFLDKCPDKIGMTKVTQPMVYEVGSKVIGMIIIAESHISFHGDLNSGNISIDIFSCLFFSFKVAKNAVNEYFPCSWVRSNFIERGMDFNRTNGGD